MKNLILKSIVSFLIILGLYSCNNNDNQVVSGTLVEASMNSITIEINANHNVDLSTMNYVSNLPNGLLLGDVLEVSYIDSSNIKVVKDIKLLKESPYYFISGSWVEPINIMPSENQGFKLYENGSAESINMHTLLVKKWTMPTLDTLVLTSESIGNDVTSTDNVGFGIEKLDKDSLVLSLNGNIVYRLHREL